MVRSKQAHRAHKAQHKKDVKRAEQVVDTAARILQIVAIISVVAIFIINGALENADVPIWVPAGLLGIAVGLSPDQIGKIVTDILKAAIGKK